MSNNFLFVFSPVFPENKPKKIPTASPCIFCLWIDSSDYQWKAYPVIKISFTAIESDSAHNLKQGLIKSLLEMAIYVVLNDISQAGLKPVATKV